MEHAFDTLSKGLARAVTRREALSTLLRGTVGVLLVSAGLGKRFAYAQTATCADCGTCAMKKDAALEACTVACEAQTLCKAAQSYSPYQWLVFQLVGLGLQATTYDALISGAGATKTKVFRTAYANSTDSTSTADLFVVWAPGSQIAAYAIQYLSSVPIFGYFVNGSNTIQQMIPPLAQLAPFTVTAAPASVTTAQGSSVTSTITTNVLSGFSSTMVLTASGLPSGARASFSPKKIAAPGSGSSIMTIKAGASTATGTYAIAVTGTAEGIPVETSVSLTVNSSGAVVYPDMPDDTSQTLEVGSGVPREIPGASGLTLQPAITACSVACQIIGYGAAYGAGEFCADAVATAGVSACLATGPLAAECLVGGALVSPLIVKKCTNGAKQLAIYLCEQVCACGPCQTNPGWGCESLCNATNCPSPYTCTAETCGCVSDGCSTGSYICGDVISSTCCPDSWSCCGNYCCGPENFCCSPAEGYCCLPTA